MNSVAQTLLGFFIKASSTLHPPAAAGTAGQMGTDVFSPFLHNNSYISVLALLPVFEVSAVALLQTRTKC